MLSQSLDCSHSGGGVVSVAVPVGPLSVGSLSVGSLSVLGPTLVLSVVAVVSVSLVVCAAMGPQAATRERRPRLLRKSNIR